MDLTNDAITNIVKQLLLINCQEIISFIPVVTLTLYSTITLSVVQDAITHQIIKAHSNKISLLKTFLQNIIQYHLQSWSIFSISE